MFPSTHVKVSVRLCFSMCERIDNLALIVADPFVPCRTNGTRTSTLRGLPTAAQCAERQDNSLLSVHVREGMHESLLNMANHNGRAIAVWQRIDEQIPKSAVRATLVLHNCHDKKTFVKESEGVLLWFVLHVLASAAYASVL